MYSLQLYVDPDTILPRTTALGTGYCCCITVERSFLHWDRYYRTYYFGVAIMWEKRITQISKSENPSSLIIQTYCNKPRFDPKDRIRYFFGVELQCTYSYRQYLLLCAHLSKTREE